MSAAANLSYGHSPRHCRTGTLNGDREFDVTAVTETAANSYDDTKFAFRVVRRPGVIRLWQLVGNSDVIQKAVPAFLRMFLAWLSRKRFVVEHHAAKLLALKFRRHYLSATRTSR